MRTMRTMGWLPLNSDGCVVFLFFGVFVFVFGLVGLVVIFFRSCYKNLEQSPLVLYYIYSRSGGLFVLGTCTITHFLTFLALLSFLLLLIVLCFCVTYFSCRAGEKRAAFSSSLGIYWCMLVY